MERTYKVHHLVALVCAAMGCSSIAKFPGASGWIGFLGWLSMALCFWVDPGLVGGRSPNKLVYPKGTPVVVATSLFLMVASVVIWVAAR